MWMRGTPMQRALGRDDTATPVSACPNDPAGQPFLEEQRKSTGTEQDARPKKERRRPFGPTTVVVEWSPRASVCHTARDVESFTSR